MYFDVGNLLELPAAAVLLCGCRSWLPVAAALYHTRTQDSVTRARGRDDLYYPLR